MLQGRVPQPVQHVAEHVLGLDEDWIPEARKAWDTVHQRKPDPSAAFTSIIRALEIALRPIVSPKDEKATLGKMMGELDPGHGKVPACEFQLPVAAQGRQQQPPFEPVRAFADLCRMIQFSESRHGASGVPENTLEQAEAAVHLGMAALYCIHLDLLKKKT